MTIDIKYWSLVWPPIDAYRINWAWITVWQLTCTYNNKRFSIRVGVSFEYGSNIWCGTRYCRQWNQDIIGVKIGISGVCLNGTDYWSTTHITAFSVEGKSWWRCTSIQTPWCSILMDQWFTLVTRKCHPLLFLYTLDSEMKYPYLLAREYGSYWPHPLTQPHPPLPPLLHTLLRPLSHPLPHPRLWWPPYLV